MNLKIKNKISNDRILLIIILALSLFFALAPKFIYSHYVAREALLGVIAILTFILLIFLGLALFANHMNVIRLKELMRSQKAIISALAGLAEWRDTETGQHLERTRHYAFMLASTLKREPKFKDQMTDNFIEGIYDAAPLHDIGKVGIPDSILHKKGKLTEDEYKIMKEHVNIGKQLLSSLVFKFKIDKLYFSIGENICAYHHEKFNGTGYPFGLKGDDIPIEARIFALCDAYDALRSKRPYKEVVPHDETAEILKKDSETHFDPDIIEAFLKCEKQFKEISNMGI